MLIQTFLKDTLSGEIIEVLEDREADLEDGMETVAVTAVAMVVMQMELQQEKARNDILGSEVLVKKPDKERGRIFLGGTGL